MVHGQYLEKPTILCATILIDICHMYRKSHRIYNIKVNPTVLYIYIYISLSQQQCISNLLMAANVPLQCKMLMIWGH